MPGNLARFIDTGDGDELPDLVQVRDARRVIQVGVRVRVSIGLVNALRHADGVLGLEAAG